MEQSNSAMNAQRWHGLDHLRTLAILSVFFYHYGRLFVAPKWVAEWTGFGWTGVDLFFVLSGFLIGSQVLKEDKSDNNWISRFYIRRFFRILPPYLFVLLIYYFIPITRERGDLAPLWKYLTFTQNLGLDLTIHSAFSHAWSLCIEEQFYLFFPLVLSFFIKLKVKRAWVLLAMVFVLFMGMISRCLAIMYVAYHDLGILGWYEWIYFPTYARLDGILVGIAIAMIRFRSRCIYHSLFGNSLFCFLAGLFIIGCSWYICREQFSDLATILGFPLNAIGYGFVVMACVLPLKPIFSVPYSFTAFISKISFGLYLIHKIVIHLLQQSSDFLGMESHGIGMMILCTICSIMVSYVIHLMIEIPFHRASRRIIQKYTIFKTVAPRY